MIDINLEIQKIIGYGKEKKFLNPRDEVYARNRIMDVLNISEFEGNGVFCENCIDLSETLGNIMLWAEENGIIPENEIKESDRLASKIMDCMMPKPSEIEDKFYALYNNSSHEATDYFYNLSVDSYYIKMNRLKKNVRWKFDSEYGKMDITINLAKPEKDPKEIAKGKNKVSNAYPKCLLCREAEGYGGRDNFPERHNHRLIQLSLCNEKWFIQYSPYMYYDEHCIVLKYKHEEMKLSEKTFERLLEFVEKFPHYFIGSNADLPIVGGSILSHDHFQGGRYEFAMAAAKLKKKIYLEAYPDVEIGILKWPMSVLRLSGPSKEDISKIAGIILNLWREHDDNEAFIISSTNEVSHNTITPIARKKNFIYEMDLVLRNNRTSEMHPYGIFHPHEELHHIKKENIGLIEVMGLAVLPGRLYREISILKESFLNDFDDISDLKEVSIHRDWYRQIRRKYNSNNFFDVEKIFEVEIGNKFKDVLWDCGVFKDDDDGMRFFMKFVNKITDYIDKD